MRARQAVLSILLLALGGCPRTFNPARPGELPENVSREAKNRFAAARALFERDDLEAAAQEFERIRRDFPGDPIAPYASLYEGMAQAKKGDSAAAAATLQPIADDDKAPPEIRERARFYLGLADAELGKGGEARALLEPFLGKLEEGEELGTLYAALAAAAEAQKDLEPALRYYDEFFARARPAERAYIAGRVAPIVDGLSPVWAQGIYDKVDKSRVVAAFLGRRLAAAARAQGDPGLAQRILAETATARQAAGLPDEGPAAGGRSDPELVGAILPLSGKRRLVGEAADRGLALAAGTFDRIPSQGIERDGVPRPFVMVVEDGGDVRGRAATAVDALAARGVVAAVGPLDHDAAEEAARRAESVALPLITLDVTEAGFSAGSPHVFRAVLPAEERARALAAWGKGQGARRFAILAPRMSYGTRAAAAFRKEVEAQGGSIVAEELYPKDATSFVEPVAKLARAEFDALFVADTAARLELIAPQLAVADLVVQPAGARRPKRGRPIVLLSTAEALTPKFLRGTGRYTAGAAFAPGFYPDEADPRIASYVARYRAAFGDDPTYLDAYAFDAALLVRAVVEGGAEDREGVAAALAALAKDRPVHGVTGDIWFDKTRNRADRGIIYVVVPDGTGFAIHARR